VRRGSKKPPGLPPGTIVYTGSEKPTTPVTVQLHVFDEDTLEEIATRDVAEIHRQRAEGRVWIDVEGVHDLDLLRDLGREFGLHPLTLEDIARTGQRPKVETYDNYAYIVVRMLRWIEEEERVDYEQVSIVFGKDYVVSFGERPGDVFTPVRQRLMNPQSHLRTEGVDHLVYRLLDVIVDNYFVVMEKLGDRLEALDAVIMQDGKDVGLNAIHTLKQESLLLRRSVWPLREVLVQLERGDNPWIAQTTRIYLRDVYDHTIEVIETIESVRDLISGMMDLHLTMVSHRMNEVMKVLTIITTLFVPLTFIVGIYGMNFDFMPELNETWAYPAVWAVMIVITIGQVIFFRRKRWI
jgi:magnesium transporter